MNNIFPIRILAVIFFFSGGFVVADETPWRGELSEEGFQACEYQCKTGSIDWTRGVIRAEGKAYAAGRSEQAKLLASRGAGLAAIRNALALLKGVYLDADGKTGDLPEGQIQLDAFVRGFELEKPRWGKDERGQYARVSVVVPLYGVKGLVTKIYDACRKRIQRRLMEAPSGAKKWKLKWDLFAPDDAIVIIDARRCGAIPALFPKCRSDDGRILYDLTVPEKDTVRRHGLVSYMENKGDGSLFLPITRRKKKKKIVVKAVRAKGNQKMDLVLTAADAKKLASDPAAARALRKARVVVVIDSAAAGIEGRRPAPLLCAGNKHPFCYRDAPVNSRKKVVNRSRSYSTRGRTCSYFF